MSRHVLTLCIRAVLISGVVLGIGWTRKADAAAAQWTQIETEKGYVIFLQNTLENLPPDHVPPRKAVVGKVSCALARGEYKSVQIGVHALAGGLQSVRLELESDLEDRVYRPIDAETRKLLLGYKNPVPPSRHGECLDESSEIASLGKGKTSFFWLTLHAKEDTAPGKHPGKIRIRPAGKLATVLDLEVTVRPYELQRARIAYAPFFYVEWGAGISLPKFAQTDEWIGAFFRDMAEHSHTSVIGFDIGVPGSQIDCSKLPPPENRTFTMLLPLAKQAGLTSPDIPVLSWAAEMLTQPEDEGGLPVGQKNKFMDWYEAERRKHGWPELVTYCQDEPGYPNPGLRKRYESLRDVRMRLGTAMSHAAAAYGLGDMHDIWIMAGGQVTPEMVAEAQRLGAEVWTYECNPSFSSPLNERHYAGLYVWAYRLKGHTTWHHYAQDAFKLVWMREGDKRPMPRVSWETRREGIDDYRYLQMLEDCVAAKPGDPVAGEAKQWMAGLRALITVTLRKAYLGKPLALDEYDQIREKAANYIQRLGPVPIDRIPTITHSYLKDEAKPFRGKSVQECIAGLADKEASVRRAAAWALFEMGPEAAPAVPALADVLDDAEVCMPAIRALEAIGPASRSALPKLTALIRHPDGFVRLGAVIAMAATGAPPVSMLAQVLQDEYSPAAEAAGRMISALGPAAALPAVLPVLNEMLDGPWETQHTALRLMGAFGPEAAPAVPHIIRNWNGRLPTAGYWIGALVAIGPGAAEAVPMLEQFRKEYGGRPDLGRPHFDDLDVDVLFALCRIRRSPEDLRALVDIIGAGRKESATLALKSVENLGKDAAGAAPQIRDLIAKGGLDDSVKKRLQALLDSMAVDAGN